MANEIIDYTGHRDQANGRFLPGNPGSTGRKPRAHEEAVLSSLTASFPAERLVEILEKALQIAESQGSARGMLAAVEFITNYQIGRPVARVEQKSSGLADIIEQLNSMESGKK